MQKSWLSGCSRLTNRLNTLIKALSPPTSRTLDWHSAEFTELQGQMFWQLTDIPPTVDRYITDIWPIVSRGASSKYQPIPGRWSISLSTDHRPTIDRPSTDYRPTIDRLSTDHRPTIDRLSTDCQPTIDRLSTNYRPTVDQLSTDCRPLYRPISTVNKIRVFQYQTHGKMFVRWNMLFTWKSSIGVLIED